MAAASKNATRTRGRPFETGNKHGKGRPAGSRNKATLVLEALIDGEGESIVRALVTQARSGDTGAARALLDRLVPPRKERPISITLPPINSANDAACAMAEVTAALAAGCLLPAEAKHLADLIASYSRVLEAAEIEERLSVLERQLDGRKVNKQQTA